MLPYGITRATRLRDSDIVDADPLRIDLADSDSVIEVSIVSQSRPQNAVQVRLDDNRSRVLLDLDFLDANDGAIIRIVHQEDHRPSLAGTVRGVSIKSRGRANLSPDHLKTIAIESAIGRIKSTVGRTTWRLYLLALISVPIATAAGIFALSAINYPEDPKIADPAKFDLASLDGQSEFAAEIIEVGLISEVLSEVLPIFFAAWALWLMMGVMMILVSGYVMSKGQIPRELALFPSTSESHSTDKA